MTRAPGTSHLGVFALLAAGCSLLVDFDDLPFEETGTGSGGSLPESCSDGVKGPDEIDVDCGGVCGPCDDGQLCAAPGDCASGFCADDRCCDAACDGDCEACDDSGHCQPYAAGEDPESQCIDHPAGFTSCSGGSACWGRHVLSEGVATGTLVDAGTKFADLAFRDVAVHPSGDVVGVGSIQGGEPPTPIRVLVQRFGTTPWQTTFGGADAEDFGRAVAITNDGDVIVAGAFRLTMLLSCEAGSGQLDSNGGTYDFFVVRLRGDSGACQWAQRYGGGATDDVRGLAVGDDDSIYLAGVYDGASSLGVVVLDHVAGQDSFVAKLDPQGNPIWATTLTGGSGFQEFRKLAVRNDSLVATGVAQDGGTFSSVAGTCGGTLPQGVVAFVTRFETMNGGASFCPGWGPNAAGEDVAIAPDDSIFVAGRFAGPVNFGGVLLTSADGTYDGFVAKLAAQGDTLEGLSIGGEGDDAAVAIAVDGSGDAVIAGNLGAAASLGGGLLPFVLNGAISTPADGAPFILGLTPDLEHRFSFAFAASALNRALSLDARGSRFAIGGSFTGGIDFGGGEIAGPAPMNAFVAAFDP